MAERTCRELQEAVSRFDSLQTKMDHWVTESLDCLRGKEDGGRVMSTDPVKVSKSKRYLSCNWLRFLFAIYHLKTTTLMPHAF